MAENKQNTTPERRPDCVTEIRMGNTVLEPPQIVRTAQKST